METTLEKVDDSARPREKAVRFFSQGPPFRPHVNLLEESANPGAHADSVGTSPSSPGSYLLKSVTFVWNENEREEKLRVKARRKHHIS